MPALDADSLIDAQDWEIKSFDIQVIPRRRSRQMGWSRSIRWENIKCCTYSSCASPGIGEFTTSIPVEGNARSAVCIKRGVRRNEKISFYHRHGGLVWRLIGHSRDSFCSGL